MVIRKVVLPSSAKVHGSQTQWRTFDAGSGCQDSVIAEKALGLGGRVEERHYG
jgi:hypothetical protein